MSHYLQDILISHSLNGGIMIQTPTEVPKVLFKTPLSGHFMVPRLGYHTPGNFEAI